MRGAGLVRMILDESKIRPIAAAGVTKVEPGRIYYELPQFRGIPLTYFASPISPAIKT